MISRKEKFDIKAQISTRLHVIKNIGQSKFTLIMELSNWQTQAVPVAHGCALSLVSLL